VVFALSRLLLSLMAFLIVELPISAIGCLSYITSTILGRQCCDCTIPVDLSIPCLSLCSLVVRDSNSDVILDFGRFNPIIKQSVCMVTVGFASSPVWKGPSQFLWCCGLSKIPQCRGLLEHQPTKPLSYSSNWLVVDIYTSRWQLHSEVYTKASKAI